MKIQRIIIVLVAAVLLANYCIAQPKEKAKKSKKKLAANVVDKALQEKTERLFLDAQRAKMIEDYETAQKQFREVLMLDPKCADAHFQLGQIYLSTAQMQLAREAAEMAVKYDPTNKWYKDFLGGILARTSPKDAIVLYRDLAKQYPSDPDFYMSLAYLFVQTKQPLEAIKVYDQFEKVFGVDEGIISQKKGLYLALNQFDKAMAELKKLEDAYPDEPTFMLMQADLYTANNMRDKAYPIYKRVLELDPENPQALLAVADYSTKQGDTTARKETFKKIFANPSLNVDAKVKMLFPYVQFFDIKKENRAEALMLSDVLTETHPKEAKAHAIRADLYYLDNQLDTALAAYKRSLDLQKDVFNVWQQLFFIYNQQRDWKTLKNITTESLEFFPNQAVTFLFKGLAETQLKEHDNALKSYAKGEKMSLDNDKLRAQILSNMGDVYHTQKQHTESDEAFDKALKLDPDNATVLNNYSYYLSLRKANLDKAKQMSAYANKLQENNDSFLDTYAWILFELGNYKEAKEWQEKAIKNGGEKSATILEHYGDILSKLGDSKGALEYWQKAKENNSESKTIDKKISAGKYVEE
jgi:tetratricopeptide (TPR) repeat protein